MRRFWFGIRRKGKTVEAEVSFQDCSWTENCMQFKIEVLIFYWLIKLISFFSPQRLHCSAGKFSATTSARKGVPVLFTYLSKWWTVTWSGTISPQNLPPSINLRKLHRVFTHFLFDSCLNCWFHCSLYFLCIDMQRQGAGWILVFRRDSVVICFLSSQSARSCASSPVAHVSRK